MAAIKIDRFGGIMPRVHPELLPDGMAVVAENCRLKNGKLVPLRHPSLVDQSSHSVYHENGLGRIGDARSLYCWKHGGAGSVRTDFLAFPGRVYFAGGNFADDEYDRVFVTGETGISYITNSGATKTDCPCVYLFDRTRNDIVRHCICKDEMDAPKCSYAGRLNRDVAYGFQGEKTVAEVNAMVCGDSDIGKVYRMSGDGVVSNGVKGPFSVSAGDMVFWGGSYWLPYGESNNIYYAQFFVTWVDEYGYESPVSEPSLSRNEGSDRFEAVPLEYNSNGYVHFEPMYIPAAAKSIRIYKTVTGDETDNVMFLKEYGRGEFDNLSHGFSLLMDDTTTGETMPEMESPPYDLRDMTHVAGGYYVGRSPSRPHTVMFSEVGYPTSWPMAYQYDIKDNIVKLAVTSNSVFALTDGYPYVLSGTAPESMTTTVLAGPAACVSEKGVCVYKNAVFFVSNAGLYTIHSDADAGTVCQNLTDRMFTKEQWQELNPSSAMMEQFDGALHLFFNKENGQGVGLIIDLMEQNATLTTHDELAACTCVDDTTDDLYFVRTTDGYEWQDPEEEIVGGGSGWNSAEPSYGDGDPLGPPSVDPVPVEEGQEEE